MGIYFLSILCGRPDDFLPVFSPQRSGINRKLEPLSLSRFGDQTHPAIAFQSAAHFPTALLSAAANFPAVIPTIDQHMRLGLARRLKGFDLMNGEIDLALKLHACLIANASLPVHLHGQGTALSQEDVQACEQTMTFHVPLFRTGVMVTQAAHPASFRFGIH